MGPHHAAVHQWRTEGWALVEELVPRADALAACAEIEGRRLDTAINRGPLRRPDLPPDEQVDDEDEPLFREEQFAGTTLFPVPDAPALNRLFVHPAIVGFAQEALGTDDLRLYQSRIWSKRGDGTNYEQPLHRDGNHSLAPLRMEAPWWYMECFLYLNDVDASNGAPHLVPNTEAAALDPPGPTDRRPVTEAEYPELYRREVAAPGPAGSLLAYRSDVWHRGMPLATGTERHVLVVAFRPAGLDWVGFDAHPPKINTADFHVFARDASPEDLALLGVPRPGHRFWNAEAVEHLAGLYRGLDVTPWREALDN
ncbi:MAG: phytanoyl-CoA dioxygenase family protein [Actinomycetota bacterium]